MRRKSFKKYDQQQLPILPLDISEMIPEGHLVRIVNSVIDDISWEVFAKAFNNEGQPPYHPRMMMKVLIYSYATKLYTSRKIEKALMQDITYMWVSGMQTPDHNTINRFRSFYFKDILEDVFTHVLDFLHDNGYIKFENYFVDGTKIKADAGKYIYVWKKNVQRYKAQLTQSVKELLNEIDKTNQHEDNEYGGKSLEELGEGKNIDSNKLKKLTEKLNKELEEKAEKKKKRSLKSKVKKLEKKTEKLQEYEKQEQVLGKRNSFSKTDKDATFMRMKGTDELRAGYNQQISTENQFVVNYSVHPNGSDTPTFKRHLKKIVDRGEKYIPKTFTGDAAYGSEENYQALEENQIDNYFKYNSFYRDIKGKNKNPFHKDNMIYDLEKDIFICPAGKQLHFFQQTEITTENGYRTRIKIYNCSDCSDCKLKEKCTKAKGNRSIQLREELEKYKAQARNNLISEKGKRLCKQRGYDVETVFGDIKFNQDYGRFRLKGIQKAEIELGFLSISHNLRKIQIKKSKAA